MSTDTLKTVQALAHEIAKAAFDEGVAHGKGAKNFCGSNGKVFSLIDALIAQMQREAVQPGWKLVPVEPTAEMWKAADAIDDRMFAGGSSHGAETGQIWEAMLDAAPHPEAQALDSQLQQPDADSTRASGVCASTAPPPEVPARVEAMFATMHRFLEWNRADARHSEPPVRVGYEYGVFEQAVKMWESAAPKPEPVWCGCGDGITPDTGAKCWICAANDAAEIEELRAATQWIPVSERLPEPKQPVLVAAEFDGPGDWRIKVGGYAPDYPGAFHGWHIHGASWRPTHWMPLPPAPKEA